LYLRRIELRGFKSFADKTTLEFGPGITAVVGPNGSGKSNVADAIRWVIGEQSARQLRGSKMEDVIFSGSETRKPLPMAQVSLTMDNEDDTLHTDYKEISITRRLDRAGGSEYFLNKRLCRLKDISELFYDTGVGKEGYSIIGQGRIEEILSAKAEDRRILFEEASGIIKYKTRKTEALKRLETTNQKMERVEDILWEISLRLGPLEEEAIKAEKAKQIQKELQELETILYLKEIQKTEAERTKLITSIETEEAQIRVLQQEIDKAEECGHTLDAKKERVEKERLLVEQGLLDIKARLNTAEKEQAVLKERKLALSRETRRLEQEKKALEDRLTGWQEDNQVELGKLEELRDRLRLLQEKIQSNEERLSQYEKEMLDLDNEAEERKSELIQLLNDLATTKHEQEQARRKIEQNTQLLQRQKEEKEKLAQKRQLLEERLSLVKEEIESLIKEQNRIQDEMKRLHVKRGEHTSELVRIKSQGSSMVEGLNKKENRLNFLLDLQASYEGYFSGVKAVLKQRDQGKNQVFGVVAELIKVPEYLETAIDVALGANIQNVVVESAKEAQEIIDTLKQNQSGRATFLPLDIIQPARAGSEEEGVTSMDGSLGWASDLIDYDSKIAHAISHLLGRVLIAKDLTVGRRLAKASGYRFRIVTLDGEVIHTGGAMTGGNNSRKSNLLSREREVSALEKEITREKQELSKLLGLVTDVEKSLEQVETRLTEYTQMLHNIQLDLREKTEQERSISSELQTSIEREELLLFDLTDTYKLEEESQKEVQAIQKRFEELTEVKESLERNMAQGKEDILAIKRKQELVNKELLNDKMNHSALEQEERSLLQWEERANAEKDKIVQELKQREKELSESLLQTEAIQKRLIDLQETIAQLAREHGEKSSDTQGLLEQQKNYTEKLKENDRVLKDIKNRQDRHREVLHNLRVSFERADVAFQNLIERLKETQGVEYTGFHDHEEKMVGKADVDKLRTELRDLGEVNPQAIDEFKELSEREAFLRKQYDDLNRAKEALYAVISGMDKKMLKMFDETFGSLRTAFQQVFKELFGGGRADLVLIDNEDPLSSGVDILAEPPGKKLQHLSLLSGGEKSLTAIALLFALLKVKPTPFCVLDEIDAALDEVNVSRYAHYLSNFAHDTQFIIITHQKTTMLAADALYGVSMDGEGISKLVSVKLSEEAS